MLPFIRFLAVCAALPGAALFAQKARVVPRPALPAGVDSNDAAALVRFAEAELDRRPAQAERAYYWAARVDPTIGRALLGQHDARLLDDRGLRRQWMRSSGSGDPGLDSLRQLAAMRDPFATSTRTLAILRQVVVDENPDMSPVEVGFAVDEVFRNASDPGSRALFSESIGDYRAALEAYAQIARKAREPWVAHAARGRLFRLTGQRDSALAALRTALQQRPGVPKGNKLVVLYQPMAMLHYAVAVLLAEANDAAGAKAALEQAIEEDASFWPAHLRLALMAGERGDSTAAKAGLELAAATTPREPMVLMELGYRQVASGQAAEAIASFKTVTQVEPWYAAPYLALGHLYASAGFDEEAIGAYTAWQARAAADDARRPTVAARLAALKPSP